MTENDDMIFVDIPTAPPWPTLAFLGIVFAVTTGTIFSMTKNIFGEGSFLKLSFMFGIAILIAVLVTLTLSQLLASANALGRKAVFLYKTELGVRKGADGLLLDLSEPHAAALKTLGDTLTISVQTKGISLRFLISGFDAPKLLERFEKAGLVSSEPSCCKGGGVTIRLKWERNEVKEFVRRLMDLIWKYREPDNSP